jgi:hypothetical protein
MKKQILNLCHYCESEDTRFVDSEDGLDIYVCRECGNYFEIDVFVAHPKKPPVKNRKVHFDDEE